MKQIFPLLYIGNSADAYNVLYTGLSQEIEAVLDCTTDMPSRKWKRNEVALKRVGFRKDKPFSSGNIRKALDEIRLQRGKNRKILVCSKDGYRAMLVALLYLVIEKGLAPMDAISHIERVTGPLFCWTGYIGIAVVAYATRVHEDKFSENMELPPVVTVGVAVGSGERRGLINPD